MCDCCSIRDFFIPTGDFLCVELMLEMLETQISGECGLLVAFQWHQHTGKWKLRT